MRSSGPRSGGSRGSRGGGSSGFGGFGGGRGRGGGRPPRSSSISNATTHRNHEVYDSDDESDEAHHHHHHHLDAFIQPETTELILKQRRRHYKSSLREMEKIASVARASGSQLTEAQESFVRKRVMYEGALQELEHIGPRLLDAMEREIAVSVANAMEEKRMKDNDDGGGGGVVVGGGGGEEKTGRSPVMASSASPKSPPRLPLKFGRTEEGVMLSPPLPPTPPSASIVAAAARMKRDGKKYDSEDLKRLVSLLYFARLFDVKDASSVEIEHARVIQRDACIAKHMSSYTGAPGSRPLTGEDLDAVVIAGRAVVCQRRDVMQHGACIAMNTKAAKLFLRKKERKATSGADLVLVKQQQGDGSSVERMSTSSRDEGNFFERMLNMGSSSGAVVATNAVVSSGGEHHHHHHNQQQSAKVTREEMDAIERARDVMDIIMAMAPTELSESSETSSKEDEDEEEGDEEKEEGMKEEVGLLGVSSRELREAEQSFSKVSIQHNTNHNNANRRREDIEGGRRDKRRNATRDASRKFPKRKSENMSSHATAFEEGAGASEDRSMSSQPQSPSTPLQQIDDKTKTTSSPKRFKRKGGGIRGGRRERERKELAQARLREREEAQARAEIDR
ncbi:unnamed protein product [Bathycoccus prasinos]